MLASHKAFSHICPNCNNISANRREKCKHLREVHNVTKSLKNSSKSHTCKRCQQVFMNTLSLGEHLISKHPEDSDLVTACPHTDCKQKFPKGSLKLRLIWTIVSSFIRILGPNNFKILCWMFISFFKARAHRVNPIMDTNYFNPKYKLFSPLSLELLYHFACYQTFLVEF